MKWIELALLASPVIAFAAWWLDRRILRPLPRASKLGRRDANRA